MAIKKGDVSEQQVALYKGGNYESLDSYLDRKVVAEAPFSETRKITMAGSGSFSVVDADTLGIGGPKIARDPLSSSAANNGGVVAVALPGALGTWSANSVADTNGAILNLLELQDASRNDPILDTDDRRVWGLMQCASSAADNSTPGGTGVETLQISLVKYDASGDLVQVMGQWTYLFSLPRLYQDRFMPALRKEGSARDVDILDPSLIAPRSKERHFTVTTAFAADEVLNVTTGSGGVSGASTPSGDTLSWPSSSSVFNTDPRVRVQRNGVDINPKGVKVIYDSSGFHFPVAVAIDEIITVFTPATFVPY